MSFFRDQLRDCKGPVGYEALAILADVTSDSIKELRGQVKQLEREVKALRNATDHCMKHRGIYQHDKMYRQGDAVTHQGSIWIQRYTESNEPPPGSGWVLAVKRGSDAPRKRYVEEKEDD